MPPNQSLGAATPGLYFFAHSGGSPKPMRSAILCAACVLQSSHDAVPMAATAAMMSSHADSMSVPPSCLLLDTEPGSLSVYVALEGALLMCLKGRERKGG